MAEHTTDQLRQSYQRVAQNLITRYGWGLLDADELAERVLSSVAIEIIPAQLEEQTRRCYTAVLFEACRQDEDDQRQYLAYTEVHRFLFRAAYSRWKDLSQDTIEDIAQQALVLVYQQIDRCSSPQTFLAFASWKLRQAAKTVFRAKSAWVFLEEDVFTNMPDTTNPADLQQQSEQAERIQALLDAINRLPDERSKKVILLKFLGYSDTDIGEQLGITANHVRVLRNHAKKLLKQDAILRRQVEANSAEDA
jgi:RNA polymerase sigma factor (sigma-70 family)